MGYGWLAGKGKLREQRGAKDSESLVVNEVVTAVDGRQRRISQGEPTSETDQEDLVRAYPLLQEQASITLVNELLHFCALVQPVHRAVPKPGDQRLLQPTRANVRALLETSDDDKIHT